jgi:hypothetical protein
MENSRVVRAKQRPDFSESRSGEWIDNELVGCEFEDVRHRKRLRQLLEQFSDRVGSATPWASQAWANTKAAYRFFGNERISKANILAGHFGSTRERFAGIGKSLALILHDTTELSCRHEDVKPIGILQKIPGGPLGRPGRPHFHTNCGILMHSSLVTTVEGLPSMPRKEIRPRAGRRSTGNCSQICRYAPAWTRSKSSSGTHNDGRSRPSIRYSNPAAERRKLS